MLITPMITLIADYTDDYADCWLHWLRFQVNAWLTWLQEVEEEDEDDSDAED